MRLLLSTFLCFVAISALAAGSEEDQWDLEALMKPDEEEPGFSGPSHAAYIISNEQLGLEGFYQWRNEGELTCSAPSHTFAYKSSNEQLELEVVNHWLNNARPAAEDAARVVKWECAEEEVKEGTPCHVWVSRAFFGAGSAVLLVATACDSATMSWVAQYVTFPGINFVIAMINPLAFSAPFYVMSAVSKYGVPKFLRKSPEPGYQAVEMVTPWAQ